MKVHSTPLAKITKAWLADAERVVRGRIPGAFNALRNFTSFLSDGIGRVRPGYQAYNDSNGGIDLPTGMDILKVASIQSPAAEDVHISFCDNSGKTIQMYPHYVGATRVAEHINIGETDTFTGSGGSDAASTIVFSGANALGLSHTADYYNGWIIIDTTLADGGYFITDYSYNIGTDESTFTVHGDPSAYVETQNFSLVRHFHDNPTFAPSYNNDLTAPATLNVENSVIRLSGGVSSTNGNRGIVIFPKLDRTFFPDTGDDITFEGTYASERECRALSPSYTFDTAPVSALTGGGDTENLAPDSALGHVGSLTVTGAADAVAAVDDGATPNDTDYWYIQVGSPTRDVRFYFPATTETTDPSGDTVVTVRHATTMSAAGSIAIDVELQDANGTQYTTTITRTNSGAALNPGGGGDSDFQDAANTLTITLPNSAVDTATLDVQLTFRYISGVGSFKFYVSNINIVVDTVTNTNYLTGGRTYWLAVAPIYDGFQLGQLYKIETGADYDPVSGAWTDNYLSTSPGLLRLNFEVNFARLNKRITGLAIYGAYDEGQVTVRSNPYYFLQYLPIASTGNHSDEWVWNDVTYDLQVTIDNTDFTNRGNTYLTDAGYLESPTDTMYSYSIEERVSGRRYIADAYIDSDNTTDTTSIFTNPTGGNGTFNSGVIQPDIFSNEEGVLKIRTDPTVGTKINGIVPTGIDAFLLLKNRGVIRSQVQVVDQLPILMQRVESRDAGLSTVNAWSKDDGGVIVFPGYDDIWAYRDGILTRLIEREDKNDWLSTYRGISTTFKENAVVQYLPELKSHIFLFGGNQDYGILWFNDLQYILGPNGWGSIYYETNDNLYATRSFKYFTSLSNGHVIGVDTAQNGTATAFRMTWGTNDDGDTYRFIFTDNDTPVIPYFDTGDIYFGDGEYLMSEFIVNRTMTQSAAGGQLDIEVSSGDEIRTNETGHDDVTSIVDDVETVERRLRMKAPPNIIHRGNKWRMVYNVGGPNHLVLGEVYQIDSIEVLGMTKTRRRELAV